MDVSPEFKLFGLQFIQDIEILGDTIEEVLDSALIPFKCSARIKLRDLLSEAVNARVSDEELQKLWNATPIDIYFRDVKELRMLLIAARDVL